MFKYDFCTNLQALLKPEASEAIHHLLPPSVNGNLSALCVWPDQIRHWYKYKWTSPLHFIDTPDKKCGFQYSSKHYLYLVILISDMFMFLLNLKNVYYLCKNLLMLTNIGDCHEDMCVAGAVKNFTSQLSHYKEGTSDRRCKGLVSMIFFSFKVFT